MTGTTPTSTITLGGGCFWCLEAVFQRLRGVLAVESGYCNGKGSAPSYEQVCSGATGHVEVVQIRFDPGQIQLDELLQVFFAVHDPTTLNRQGADVGTQYRSGIYYSDEAQHAVARQVLGEAQAARGGRVVTELLPLSGYSRAEEYHQRYFERNPQAGYCAFVVAPKVDKFSKAFARLLRDDV
ncbi:MAG: peptide-methionine (S)-S-oxide reductase MsrA [Inhella sp.]